MRVGVYGGWRGGQKEDGSEARKRWSFVLHRRFWSWMSVDVCMHPFDCPAKLILGFAFPGTTIASGFWPKIQRYDPFDIHQSKTQSNFPKPSTCTHTKRTTSLFQTIHATVAS
jgi:hypothetical protein